MLLNACILQKWKPLGKINEKCLGLKLWHFSVTFTIMSDLEYAQYPFLKELGIEEENLGVFNGEWIANGPMADCLNPSTNKPICRVKTVSVSSVYIAHTSGIQG